MNSPKDLILLSDVHETLLSSPEASQRDISKALNMSLGMTNNILKRFVDKGWIYMNKISARNIRYVLTPEGLKEVAKRSYNYIKRTIKNVYDYKELILNYIQEEKEKGTQNVILLGEDDIAFIIEYACQKNNISFCNIKSIEEVNLTDDKVLFLLSENICEEEIMKKKSLQNVKKIVDILLEK
jgi:DNA-binding MarR family transcriptional regulator